MEKVRVITVLWVVATSSMPEFVVVGAHIFGIGRVEHEQDGVGQARAQALDLVEGEIGAGRVVWVGEEDHARGRGHAGKNLINIGGELFLRRNDRRGPRARMTMR